MTQVFTSGDGKTLTGGREPTTHPGESSNGEAHIQHVRVAILGQVSQGWGWRFD